MTKVEVVKMLIFFRLLRKKLLDEGHIRKYVWYALGEILLVMIGILLALQVNNWNEANKTRAQEKVLRANLVESVGKAGETADVFIGAEESNIKILEEAIQNWENLTFDDIDDAFRPFQNRYFSPLFNLSGYSHFFDPETVVYNTAVSDGSISIIQDDQFLQWLDALHNYVMPRVNELMLEEYVLHQSINDHIAVRYEELFLKNTIADSTLNSSDLWTDQTYNELFIQMRKDGVLKYKFSQRIELKRSRLLLVRQAKRYIELITEE